jgi:hypothetical protein
MNSFKHNLKPLLRKYIIRISKYTVLCFSSYYFIAYFKPHRKIGNFYKKGIKLMANEVINSKEIKGDSLNLIEKWFKESSLINIQLYHLKKAVTSEEFKIEAIIFSKEWIVKVFKNQEFISFSKVYFTNVSKEKAVVNEAVKILEDVVKNNNIVTDYGDLVRRSVMNYESCFYGMLGTLGKAAISTFADNKTKSEFSKNVLEIVSSREFLKKKQSD